MRIDCILATVLLTAVSIGVVRAVPDEAALRNQSPGANVSAGIARKEQAQQQFEERQSVCAQARSVVVQMKDKRDQGSIGCELWRAVRALEIMRDDDAVPMLLDIIDKSFSEEILVTLRPPTDSDVIRALSTIGKAASRQAIERLGSDKSASRAVKYVRVVYLVEGLEVGRFMLQNAAEKEKDPEKKARLVKAIDLFGNADKEVP